MITALASSTTDIEGLAGVRSLAFNPERGTGQADIGSPYTLLAVVGVQVTACKSQRASHCFLHHHFQLRRPDCSNSTARLICYGNDVQSYVDSLRGLKFPFLQSSRYGLQPNRSYLEPPLFRLTPQIPPTIWPFRPMSTSNRLGESPH